MYTQHLAHVSKCLVEIRQALVNRKKIDFHPKAGPSTERTTKEKKWELGWFVRPRPPISLNPVSNDHYRF